MTEPYLLDVNVLLALAWPSHVHHSDSQRWFSRKRKAGFRTCPLTQIAFVRISSNPKFSTNAVMPQEALELLREITSLPEHAFWPDDLPFYEASEKVRTHLAGHRQATDIYLLALAASHGGKFATLDRAAASLSTAAELIA